jgi:hypothetical protein
MVATVELQVRADKFARSILTAIRSRPFCLPPPVAGLQLQRVHFLDAQLRHDQTKSFQVWLTMGPWDQGLPWTWIEGKQVQLELSVLADLTFSTTIDANPNQFIGHEYQVPVTLVLDLDASPSGRLGWVDIDYELTGVVTPATNLPGGAAAEQWLRQQIGPLLPHEGNSIDLSSLTPNGAAFQNAGIAMDVPGGCIAIRAELPMTSTDFERWFVFRNGGVVDALGGHDWGLFLSAADLKHALWFELERGISDALKGNDVHLISVPVDYSPQPGHAVFTITPYFDVPIVGTEDVPFSLTLWVDGATGDLVVDFDGYGIRDRVDSILDIADIVISLVLPVVGPVVAGVLNDAISDTMHVASSAAAQAAQGKVPAGASVEQLPGEPFRYRARTQLPVPPGINGRIEALVAMPDGVAFAGTWSILNFVEGEMSIDVSQWGWQAPGSGCGSAAERLLRDIDTDPKSHSWLYAQVELSATGSAPVNICDVIVLSGPADSTGFKIIRKGDRLPTTIELHAPSSFADLVPPPQVELEIRTSAGIFRVSIAPPPPITPEDVARMQFVIRARLAFCDAHVKPAWYDGKGKFDLSWIENPLLDPDPQGGIDHLRLEVSGLASRSMLLLEQDDGRVIGEAVAGPAGTASLSAFIGPSERAPQARIRAAGGVRAPARTVRERNVVLRHERFQPVAAVNLSRPVTAAARASNLGPQTFFLAGSDRILLLDASHARVPVFGPELAVPGVAGVVAQPHMAFAFGESGLVRIERSGNRLSLERLLDEPVMACAAARSNLVVGLGDRIEVRNRYGALMSQIALDDPAIGIAVLEGDFFLAARSGLSALDLRQSSFRPLAGKGLGDIGAGFFKGAAGALLAAEDSGGLAELRLVEAGLALAARYANRSWGHGLVRAGRLALHLNDGFSLGLFRVTPERIASPPERR